MALHDFWCQTCGQVLVDVNVPIAIGAQAGAPLHCDQPTAWIPQVGRMDAYEPFQEFETFDGQNRPVLIDSLHKMRALERQSEADARDGRGQPMVWRRYSQDASNRDVHTLAPRWTGGEAPDPAFVKKQAGSIQRHLGDGAATDVAYGPGVDDQMPSALDHLTPTKD